MEDKKAAPYGFVYVLGNYSMPGIFKIGATTRSPTQRCGELSAATSCPEEFVLLFYAEVERPFAVESEMHLEFSNFRISQNREFFRLAEDQLQDLESLVADYSLTFCHCEMRPYCYLVFSHKEKLIRHFVESGYADIFEETKYDGGI